MHTIAISDARRFSLARVERRSLVDAPDLRVELICFEAGQRDEALSCAATASYQVLEGEALVRAGDEVVRLGKGKLLAVDAGELHTLENAGGGLLVVMSARTG
ncbi:MAG: cupin domain-containing protein [bacterium]|nr:cupin domain-containing protein [bacterium]